VNLLGIISGALKLAGIIGRIFSRRQLMRAGAAQATAKAQTKVLENVEIAKGVTHLVEHGDDGDFRRRLRDRFRRKPDAG